MSIFKGYPFCAAVSLNFFPLSSRPTGQQIEGAAKDGIGVPADIIGQYSKALHEAEQQIKDMQTNYPFIAEDYGFEEVSVVGFIIKYKSSTGNVGIDRINDCQYRVRATFREFVDSDGNTIEEKSPIDIVVMINNEKEAYSVFKSLGLTKYIKSKDETRDGELVSVSELVLNHPELPAEEKTESSEESADEHTTENTEPK